MKEKREKGREEDKTTMMAGFCVQVGKWGWKCRRSGGRKMANSMGQIFHDSSGLNDARRGDAMVLWQRSESTYNV